MEQTKIYLELSDELEEVLNDNGISVEDILEQEGIEAEVTYGVMPTQAEEGARSKDIVPIILASSTLLLTGSAFVFSVGMAISKVLSTLHQKSIHVKQDGYVVVRDANRNVVRDENGKPLVKKVKIHKLLKPTVMNETDELEVKKDAFALTLSSTKEQPNTPDSTE